MKRRTRWRFAGLGILLAVAAFALVLILPFVKEGAAWSDLPMFAATAGACLALAAIWWMGSGFSAKRAALGWVILAVPFVAHASAAGGLIFERFGAERLERRLKIADYQEKWLELPGFDGPVGLEMTLQLEHPAGIDSFVHPPELRMGPQVSLDYGEHYAQQTLGSGFVRPSLGGSRDKPLAVLKTVLFQKRFANPASVAARDRFNAVSRFDGSGTTGLRYVLMPGIVDFLGEHGRICLNSRVGGLPVCGEGVDPAVGCASRNRAAFPSPAYSSGQTLSSLWVAGETAVLSRVLDETLRTSSRLEGDPQAWMALHRRVEPAGLVRAGYALCAPGSDSHTAQRVCYCAGASEP